MNNTLFEQAYNNPSGFTPVPEISEAELFAIAGSETPPIQQQAPPVTGQGAAAQMPAQQSMNIGSFIDEKVATEFIDIGMSTVVGIALRQFASIKPPKNSLKATDSEKEMLYPSVKEVLRLWNIKVTNPYEALVYAALCIYGSKAALVTSEESFKKSESKVDDLNDLIDQMPKKTGRGRPRKNV